MKSLTRKLQKTKKEQYTLTIPKHLVQLLGWDEKSIIEFGFDQGKLTIKKISARKTVKDEKKGE